MVENPIQAFHASSFGTIVKVGNGTYEKIPMIEQYAAEWSKVLGELYETECAFGRNVLICSTNALKTESCLNTRKYCRFDWLQTNETCTFAYTPNGVAMYRSNIKELQLAFIKNDVKEQIIHCSTNENIIIPIKTTNHNVTVKMTDVQINETEMTEQPVVITMDKIENKFNQKLEEVQKNQDQADNYIHTKIWMFVVVGIVLFAVGAIAMFFGLRLLDKQTRLLADEMNCQRVSFQLTNLQKKMTTIVYNGTKPC